MHHTRKRRRRTLLRFLAFFAGGALVGSLSASAAKRPVRVAVAGAEPEVAPVEELAVAPPAPSKRGFGRRLAFASIFTAIFVGGGALSAFGGDQVVQLVDGTGADTGSTPARTTAAAAAPAVQLATADSEAAATGMASLVWLNRKLADPSPPSSLLLRPFGRMLVHTSDAKGVEWPLVLGILRAEGEGGRVPATRQALEELETRLAQLRRDGRDDWQAAADITGDPSLADRAVGLAHYHHAIGIETVISGLDTAERRLSRRLLADPMVSLYPGGRAAIEHGRVDVRVLAVISYLRDTFDSIDVSSLGDGRNAVDVAALGGTTIEGHQEPGGLTDDAVRALLVLPPEAMPKQVVSLLALGGPSLGLADHYDHIHIGY